MPIEVELPDGSIAEFPDGTDNATMERALSSYASPKKQTAGAKKPTGGRPIQAVNGRMPGVSVTTSSTERARKPARPRDMTPAGLTGISDAQMRPESFGQNLDREAYQFLQAAGHNVVAPIVGTGQAILHGIAPSGPAFGPLGRALQWQRDATDNAVKSWEGEYQQDVPNTPAAYAGAATGQIAPLVYGAPARAMAAIGPRGAGTLAKIAGGARQGAVIGAMQPVTGEGGYGAQKAEQAGIGALAGSAGQVVGDALVSSGAKAANAIPQHLKTLYAKAQAMGIQLTPAQLTDSGFVRRLSLMTDNLPFSGAPGRRAAQQTAGNRATAKAIGENSDAVDQTTMANAYQRLGQEFDQHFASGMRYDRQFLKDVAAARNQASGLDENAMRVAGKFADRIRSQSSNGQISGRTLQSMDQQLREWSTGGGDRERIATTLRNSLHNAYERQSSPAAREAWRQTRQQYAVMKNLEPLVANYPEGGIPIQQLQSRINTNKAGKTARARGNDGPLGDIASIGQRMKLPNSSGTGENIQAAGMSAGAVANLPMTLASLLGGATTSRMLASKTLAELMMRNGAGSTRTAAGQALKRQVLTPAAAKQKQEQKK